MKDTKVDLRLTLQQILSQGDEYFEFLQDASSDGLWCYAHDSIETCWANHRFWITLGHIVFEDECSLQLSDLLECFVPEERSLVHNNILSQIKFGNRRSDQVFRLVHKEGSEVWMRFLLLHIPERDYTPALLIGIGTNITPHKEAFLKTERDTKYYKALLDAQSIFAVFYDTEGRYAYVNEYFCRSIKRSRESVVGSSSLSFMPESEHHLAYEVYVFCVEHPGQRKKTVLTKLDGEGSKRITQWEFVALFDDLGRYEGLLGFGVDITEAHRTEVLLNEQLALQNALNESTDHAIFVVNRQGKYTSFNPIHKELVYKLNGVHIALGDDMLDCISNFQERERASRFIQKVFAGESLYETWVVADSPTGKVYYNLIATPVNDVRGQVIGAVVQSYDTTAQHQIQEKLTLQNEELLKREQMLLGIAKASEELLRNTDFDEAMEHSLQILMQSMRADQAYFFKYFEQDQHLFWRHVYECYASGASPVKQKPDMQSIPVDIYLPTYEILQSGKVFQTRMIDLPESDFRTLMKSQGILAFIFFPISASDKHIGFIGFNDCTHARVWNDSETALIQSFGHSISAAYMRDQSDLLLKRDQTQMVRTSHMARVGWYEHNFAKGTNEWSDVIKELHEVAPDYEPDLRSDLRFYKEGRDREIMETVVHNALEHGQSFDVELQMLSAKGNERWVRIIGETEFENGRCIRLFGTYQDVHHQKLSEKALKESEALFRSIVENANDAIIIIDASLTFYYLSPNWEKMTGYAVDSWIGRSASEIIHPDDIALVRTQMDELVREVRIQGEVTYRLMHKEGRICWHFTKGTVLPVSQSDTPMFLAIARDITESKHAQEALLESMLRAERSAKQYKSILDSQAVYVIKTDLQGRYTYANDYFLSKFGFLGNLIGKDGLESVIPEDHETLKNVVQKCFETPEVPHEVILRKPTESGVIKAGKWEFKGVLNEHTGQLNEILCVGFDVTNEVANLEAANKLLELTKSQNQRLIEYTHITSHNLRAPVARIMGLCHLLTNEPTNLQYREMLNSSAHTLDDTIRWMNKLLDIENEGQTSTKTEVQLLPIVLYNVELFRQDLQDAEVHIHIPEAFRLDALPLYIDSIINNLISNAVKYRHPSRTLVVQFKSHQKSGFQGFSIEDNGIGIDLERYGDRLFKLKGRLNTSVEGKGIGLFFTKRQVESMGGSIEVDSDPEKGTRFTVWLPILSSVTFVHE